MGYLYDVNWTGDHHVYNLTVGGSWNFTDMAAVQAMIPPMYLNTSLVRIHRYKERSEVVEQQVHNAALGAGGAGVVLVCCACFGGAPAVVGYVGLAMAGGAVVAEVTAPLYAFHEFVVFECTDGFFLSVEKNNQHVSVQISKQWDQIISYKDGVEHRRNHQIEVRQSNDVRHNHQNRRPTIQDVLSEAVETPEYSTLTCNCHHFAGQLMNRFALPVARPAGCAGCG